MFSITRTICKTSLLNKSTGIMLTRSQTASFSSNKLEVYHDKKNSEFSIEILSDKAFLKYSQTGNILTLEHTSVPEIFQGKGVGKLLSKAAFDFVKSNDYRMILECTYLQHIYQQNPNDYTKYLVL